MKTAIRHQQFRTQRELSTRGKQSKFSGHALKKANLVIPAKKYPVGHPLALTGIVADPPKNSRNSFFNPHGFQKLQEFLETSTHIASTPVGCLVHMQLPNDKELPNILELMSRWYKFFYRLLSKWV